MQRNLPAHLQQYVGANKPAFIPSRAQAELTAHMQKVMPDHLKQYAGAYVEQNVMTRPSTPTAPAGRPPMPDRLNRSHSGDIAAEQANAQFLNLFQSDQTGAAPVQPNLAAQAPVNTDPNSNYDFIMNPEQPKRPSAFNFGGSSTGLRIAVVVGGLFLLLILFIGFKNILASSNKSIPSLVGIVQDQQELVHLTTDGVQNASSGDLKNFAVTAQASLKSEKSDLVTYLLNNHRKVNAKEQNLKVSKSTDDQLSTALATSSYDPTFKQIMQTKLASYKQHLSAAYNQTKGPKGRALLQADYDAASLLLKQLGS